jgi:hypothetical protein
LSLILSKKKVMCLPHVSSIFKKISPKTFGLHCVFCFFLIYCHVCFVCFII